MGEVNENEINDKAPGNVMEGELRPKMRNIAKISNVSSIKFLAIQNSFENVKLLDDTAG